jgi:DNA-binding transcriptional LysR family regulator
MDTIVSMTVFRNVVESGSFSAVSRAMGLSQPTVSKHVAALEKRLGTRLLNRSTRQLNLTDAGQEHYEHCVRILDDLTESETSVGSGITQPKGMLRVSTPMAFGRLQVLPRLWEFLDEYPDLNVDLLMDDHNVDLVKEGIDVVLRMGPMASSSLVAQKIGDFTRVTIASPDYLDKHGEPKVAADLKDHECLVFTLLATRNEWQFNGPKGVDKVRVHGRFTTNSPDAIREAALAGMGIAVVPIWLVDKNLERGDLKIILGGYKPVPIAIHAAYPDRHYVPNKVRYFIEHVRSTLKGSVISAV